MKEYSSPEIEVIRLHSDKEILTDCEVDQGTSKCGDTDGYCEDD